MKTMVENASFAVSVLLLGMLFTPVVETAGWSYYALPILASIFLGMGLHLKQQLQKEEKLLFFNKLSLLSEQQDKQYLLLENKFKEQNQALGLGLDKLNHQLRESTQSLERIMETEERTEGLLSQFHRSLSQQLQHQHEEYGQWGQGIAEQISTRIEQNGNELKEFHSSSLLELRRITDSIVDLERKLEMNVGRVIDTITDGQDTQEEFQDKLDEYFGMIKHQYEEFNENIVSYQMKVKHTSNDIEEYRNDIENDIQERLSILQSLVDTLSETTSQLADSKYHEREQALRVQKKLSEQFERLVRRG